MELLNGKPETEPPALPYTYRTGDYFIVSVVGTSTKYKPNGTTYDGSASVTVETNPVSVDDIYRFDGAVWKLIARPSTTTSFANLAGSPYDNSGLASALNNKVNQDDLDSYRTAAAQDVIDDDLQQEISDVDSKVEQHKSDTNNPHSVTKAQVGLANVDNTSDLDKPISTATQTALNTKQDKLTAGDNIVIDENNVISAIGGGANYVAGDNITISPVGYIGVGYKPLLYVQSDGVHYIDTGRPYTENSVITMYAKGHKTFTTSGSECLAGSSTASTTESSVGFIANGDKYVGGQLGSRAYSNNSDLEMEEIKLNIPEGKIYFNGTNPITHAATPTNLNAYLFAYNRDDEAYKIGEGRIQRYTQVDDGVAVLDYVACVRESDDTVGFYDKVSNTFVTCEGLIAGPDMSNRFEISATDTTYTAGTGIDITNGVISSTQTSAEWGNITGTLSDQEDLQDALDEKQDKAEYDSDEEEIIFA